MGEAILKGLLVEAGVEVGRIVVTARRSIRAEELASKYGVKATTDNVSAVAEADLVLLGVKPQMAASVLSDPLLREALDGCLVVSICAGVNLEQLDRWLPGTALIRAMPNTPCIIGEGMTVLCRGPRSNATHLDWATSVFAAVGRCCVLEEKHLDAVTALSASGPAFAFVILESLADGGVMMGLPRDTAVELAAQMMQGAARLVLNSGLHPAALKDDVTTPAGCTIAGLLTMEDGRIRSTLARTIQEATSVASRLGRDSE